MLEGEKGVIQTGFDKAQSSWIMKAYSTTEQGKRFVTATAHGSGGDGRADADRSFLDDDADLAPVEHVVEGPDLPLLVPVVHLPQAAGDEAQAEADDDLFHHARAFQRGMGDLVGAGHLPAQPQVRPGEHHPFP